MPSRKGSERGGSAARQQEHALEPAGFWRGVIEGTRVVQVVKTALRVPRAVPVGRVERDAHVTTVTACTAALHALLVISDATKQRRERARASGAALARVRCGGPADAKVRTVGADLLRASLKFLCLLPPHVHLGYARASPDGLIENIHPAVGSRQRRC